MCVYYLVKHVCVVDVSGTHFAGPRMAWCRIQRLQLKRDRMLHSFAKKNSRKKNIWKVKNKMKKKIIISNGARVSYAYYEMLPVRGLCCSVAAPSLCGHRKTKEFAMGMRRILFGCLIASRLPETKRGTYQQHEHYQRDEMKHASIDCCFTKSFFHSGKRW